MTHYILLIGFVLAQVMYIIIIFQIKLDFTLGTQVRADGDEMLVGLSPEGREVFKLILKEGKKHGESSKERKGCRPLSGVVGDLIGQDAPKVDRATDF